MSSPSNSENSSPSISDVMNLLSTMKKENEEAMKEILTKLKSIEDDNRKLRQELLEVKCSLKHNHNGNSLSSRKRNQSEDEAEDKNEHSKTKKARVSVDSVPDPPASFNTLDDDCLGNVLDFVGKKCYSAFGHVNKRCHEMFCSKGFPKETYLFGYAPLHLILQQLDRWRGSNFYFCRLSEGVLYYNRRDIIDWMLTDESEYAYGNIKWLCEDAIEESRLDILREVFDRAYEQQLEYLRDVGRGFDLCATAARKGKLECLKLLRQNRCEWDEFTWDTAKLYGHDHILDYLRDNDYPTEWQN